VLFRSGGSVRGQVATRTRPTAEDIFVGQAIGTRRGIRPDDDGIFA